MIACPADSQSFHSIGTRDSARVGPESWLGGFIDQALASFGGKYAVIQQTRMGHGKALYSAVPGGTSCFLWTFSRHWPAPAQSAVRVLHAGLLSVAPPIPVKPNSGSTGTPSGAVSRMVSAFVFVVTGGACPADLSDHVMALAWSRAQSRISGTAESSPARREALVPG